MVNKEIADIQLMQQNHQIGEKYSKLEEKFIHTLMKSAALEQKLIAVARGKEELKPQRHEDFKKNLTEIQQELHNLSTNLITISSQVEHVSKQVRERGLISRNKIEEAMYQMDVSFGNIKRSATDIDLVQLNNIANDAKKILAGIPASTLVAQQDIKKIIDHDPQLIRDLAQVSLIAGDKKVESLSSAKMQNSGRGL